jgi:hypothetical protein
MLTYEHRVTLSAEAVDAELEDGEAVLVHLRSPSPYYSLSLTALFADIKGSTALERDLRDGVQLHGATQA